MCAINRYSSLNNFEEYQNCNNKIPWRNSGKLGFGENATALRERGI